MFIKTIENQIFRNAAPLAVRYLTKPDLKTPHPLAQKVQDQAAREFQIAPPVTIHQADPRLMAGVWSAAREAYVVNQKDRTMREAVAAAVSTLNECPYCVTVHASLFASTGGDVKQLQNPSQLPPDIASAYGWAQSTLSPDHDLLRHPSIAHKDVPQIFATALIYHYLNRVVSVFLGETPVALPGMKSTIGQKMMQASFTFFGKRFANLDPQPGQFLLADEPALPEVFSWAAPNPFIAKALAQFAFEAQRAGDEAVSDDVRAIVLKHLSQWHGEAPPLSRSWIEPLISDLDEASRPAARLALLTARSPWQVDKSLIAEFRKNAPSDKELLQTVAWASFAATHRIASWFKTP